MTLTFTEGEVGMMRAALERWGLASQVGQAVEECAELIVALQKYSVRTRRPEAEEAVLDEIADVEMMLGQLRLALGVSDAALRGRMEAKFKKLGEYLAEGTV
ncbi:MAG: hypothetical protein FWE70_04765 [Oscillospiraceae bacterium]|nr:hypothetical protein [Oscillospiraceae bacterium]